MSATERPMAHEEARDALPALALDALDARERDAVLAHVNTCAECRRELAALRDATAAMAHTAPSSPMDAVRASGVRSRLVARAAADSLSRRTDAALRRNSPSVGARVVELMPFMRSSSPGARILPWLAAAAALIFALVVGRRDRDETNTLRSQLAQASDSLVSARIAASERDRAVAALTGPSVKVVELTSAGAKEPLARMFWDRATNTWTMYAYNLPAPSAGKTYELWLITGSAKIPAGTFTPDSAGAAHVQAQYALGPQDLKAIAVTMEPTGGVPQPTGPIVIAGAAN